MGSRVQIGPMSYVVLDTEWQTELSGREGTKRPQHRFLIVRLTMTNSGGKNVNLPLFTLIGANETQYSEVSEGIENVNGWLGALRQLSPAQTEQGAIVFDAPQASYKLQLSDGGAIDSEKTALVDLPLDFKNVAPPSN